MSERVSLILFYCLEVVYVLSGMLGVFGGKLKRQWIIVISGACYIGCMCLVPFPISENSLEILYFVGSFLPYVICFVTIIREKPKRIGWLIGRLLVLTYIDELLTMCINYMLSLSGIRIADNMKDILTLIVLIVIMFVCANNKGHFTDLKIEKIMRKSMIPMLVFFTFEIMSLTIWLDIALRRQNQKPGYYVVGMTSSFFSMLSIGIFIIMVLYIKTSNEKMEQLLVTEKQMKQYQRDYYETLLEKESETRKYRHDMKGHMVCLESLAYDRDIDGLVDYIRIMNSYVEEIQQIAYCTKIRIFDILFNYYCKQLDENTRIVVSGEYGYVIDVPEMEQCIIFSNLIKNAVESIERVKDQPTILQVSVLSGQDTVNIRVVNSFNEKELKQNVDGTLLTSKKDAKNHGFGINNIIKTVEKNAGTFEYYIENHQFVCEVSLPAKVAYNHAESSA